jgi:hypothetical protein
VPCKLTNGHVLIMFELGYWDATVVSVANGMIANTVFMHTVHRTVHWPTSVIKVTFQAQRIYYLFKC